MKVLSTQDLEALTQLLLEELPVQVLDYVSHHTGQPAVQVAEAIVSAMPAVADVPQVRQHVSDVVNWFVDRGDICYSLQRKLFVVPPHASFSSMSPGPVLSLFGNPSIELQLRSAFEVLGGRVERTPVYESQSGSPIGLERRLAFSDATPERIEATLQSLGITVIDSESV